MSAKTIFEALLTHRRWAMARIFDAAALLSEEQYRAETGHSHGNLHALFCHVLRVDNIWRNVVTTPAQPFRPLAPEAYPDLASVRAAWEQEDQALAGFVAGLSDDALAGRIPVRDPRSGSIETTASTTPLVQLFMHGMQHRTEAAMILSGLGHSPGDLDFVYTEGLFEPQR
jgi:uncharacterized damage-inducible protein DinB